MYSALNEHSSTHRIAGQVGHMYSALKSSIAAHIALQGIVLYTCIALRGQVALQGQVGTSAPICL